MSHDEIKLNYGLAEDMIKTFVQSREQLQDVSQEMQTIANVLEEGGLVGQGGSAFVDAIRSQLTPSLARLIEKYDELQSDVQKAVDFMQEADRESAGKF